MEATMEGTHYRELEGFSPLKDCVLWKLQSAFYERHSADAWAKSVVPHFVTSNAWLAKQYAQMLVAFANDWFK